MNIFKRYASVYTILILLAVSFTGGFYLGKGEREIIKVDKNGDPIVSGEVNIDRSRVKTYLGKDVDFDLFFRVWDMLKGRYVDQPVSETKLFYGALEGMVAGLGDPYSVFLTPKVSEEFSESLNGRFEGIGAEIAIKNNILTIVSPLPDSPAELAGLKARDSIIAIDGASTEGMALDEAVSRIRGEKGTTVELTVVRKDVKEPLKLAVGRDTIQVKSVRLEMREDSIAVIKMTNFNTDTAGLFAAMEREIVSANPKGVILDLRNNAGGFLQTAVDVASAWGGDKVVVKERSAEGPDREYKGRERPLFANIPTVILVNGGSASASEIVAGALQDWGAARIIGEQTFGKGSVQVLEEFPDGSSVKFTIARWYTPNDRSIDEAGITPDEIIELSEEDFSSDKDPQIDRAVEYLTK